MEKENYEMKKLAKEYENIAFVNMFTEGGFVKCKEFSAAFVAKLKGYKLTISATTNGFIFFECGFPLSVYFEIRNAIKEMGYNYRVWNGTKLLEEFADGQTPFTRDKAKIINDKKEKISLEWKGEGE